MSLDECPESLSLPVNSGVLFRAPQTPETLTHEVRLADALPRVDGVVRVVLAPAALTDAAGRNRLVRYLADTRRTSSEPLVLDVRLLPEMAAAEVQALADELGTAVQVPAALLRTDGATAPGRTLFLDALGRSVPPADAVSARVYPAPARGVAAPGPDELAALLTRVRDRAAGRSADEYGAELNSAWQAAHRDAGPDMTFEVPPSRWPVVPGWADLVTAVEAEPGSAAVVVASWPDGAKKALMLVHGADGVTVIDPMETGDAAIRRLPPGEHGLFAGRSAGLMLRARVRDAQGRLLSSAAGAAPAPGDGTPPPAGVERFGSLEVVGDGPLSTLGTELQSLAGGRSLILVERDPDLWTLAELLERHRWQGDRPVLVHPGPVPETVAGLARRHGVALVSRDGVAGPGAGVAHLDNVWSVRAPDGQVTTFGPAMTPEVITAAAGATATSAGDVPPAELVEWLTAGWERSWQVLQRHGDALSSGRVRTLLQEMAERAGEEDDTAAAHLAILDLSALAFPAVAYEFVTVGGFADRVRLIGQVLTAALTEKPVAGVGPALSRAKAPEVFAALERLASSLAGTKEDKANAVALRVLGGILERGSETLTITDADRDDLLCLPGKERVPWVRTLMEIRERLGDDPVASALKDLQTLLVSC